MRCHTQRSSSGVGVIGLDDSAIPPFVPFAPGVPSGPSGAGGSGSGGVLPPGVPSSRHVRRQSAAAKVLIPFPARRLSSSSSATSLLPTPTGSRDGGGREVGEEGDAGDGSGWVPLAADPGSYDVPPHTVGTPSASGGSSGLGMATVAGRLSMPPSHHRSATMGSIALGGSGGVGGAGGAGAGGGAPGTPAAGPKRVFIPTNRDPQGTRPRSVSSLVTGGMTPTGGGGAPPAPTSYLKEMAKRQAHAGGAGGIGAGAPGAVAAAKRGAQAQAASTSGAPGSRPGTSGGGGGGAASGSDSEPIS